MSMSMLVLMLMLMLVPMLVLVLVLVLIDVKTSAKPSFSLRVALRVFGMAWHGLNSNSCCVQSGARL
jgi:hypothetical protein